MYSSLKIRQLAAAWGVTLFTALSPLAAHPPQEEGHPTVAQVEQLIEQLSESEAEDTPALLATYEQTLKALRAAESSRIQALQYAAEVAEAPALLDAVRADLEQEGGTGPLVADSSLPLAELIAAAERSEAELDAARAHVDELESIADQRTNRKAALPGDIAQAQQALSSTEESLAATPLNADNAPRRGLLHAQAAQHRARLEALKAERGAYEARSELLPLRRDRAAREYSVAEARFNALQDQLGSRRELDGEAAATESNAQFAAAAASIPQLAPLAEANLKVSALRSGENSVPRALNTARESLKQDREILNEIASRFRSTSRRERAGALLTEGAGFVLRRDYEWLPREAYLRAQATIHAKELSAAQVQLILLEEQRSELRDLESASYALFSPDTPDEESLDTVRRLLGVHRDSLDAVIKELGALTNILDERVHLGGELQVASASYRGFIEQRILWVRSSSDSIVQSLVSVPEHLGEMYRSVSARKLWSDLRNAAASRPLLSFLPLAFALSLLASRRFLRRTREQMGKEVRSYKSDRYIFTVRACVQTLLIALPLPLLAWTLAQLLEVSSQELVRAAGSALRETACVWLTLSFLYGLLEEKSVGPVHFKWPIAKTSAVRGTLRWFIPVAVPLAFVALALDRQSHTSWSDSVGRLSFIAAMIALASALHWLLREESTLWGTSLRKAEGLLSRTHRIWSLVATGLPIALVVLSLTGYYYTALQLELRARYSLALALGLVVINALMLRWLFMTRRRLAVSQALEARAQKAKSAKAEGVVGESGQSALDAEKVDIPAVDAQTRQLFRSSITLAVVLGLYLIWAATLPALKGLSRVQLLPHPAIVDVASQQEALPLVDASASVTQGNTNAGPSPSPLLAPGASSTSDSTEQSDGLPSVLTLADVLLATIFLLLTVVATRNLPALLELAVLQRLPLDSGSRHALSTLMRYLILMIGVSAISGALGVGWQQVQWLAAALTFGLAFGLQEIFANFVSGVIILIERPVRVGDIVTVGSTEGRVTQLRMRATTILDWDRKEYLVPNKEFITSSVVNWTLSDPITRIVISVGIAYGSDTARARALLLEVARSNALVADDPAPSALFRRFGDSTLDFELRVFVENRDLWPKLIDQLHSSIDAAFRDAGIEIAFPQRDLHIRSAAGLSSTVLHSRKQVEED